MDVGLIVGQSMHHLVVLVAKASTSPLLWYMTRAAAFSAYIAMVVAIILGMLRTIARGAGERLSWIVDELHQFTTLIGFLFVIGHLVTLYLDPFLPFSVVNFLLPINEPYAPVAVTFGVFAFYLLLVIQISSWLRSYITYRLWRGLHYLTFVCFALVTVHGLQAGSDSSETWMRATYVGCGAAIAFLLLVRLFTAKAPAAVAR
jgi:predicted ferric reductase